MPRQYHVKGLDGGPDFVAEIDIVEPGNITPLEFGPGGAGMAAASAIDSLELVRAIQAQVVTQKEQIDAKTSEVNVLVNSPTVRTIEQAISEKSPEIDDVVLVPKPPDVGSYQLTALDGVISWEPIK